MKLLDLFSGIGGFSLAAHWAGIETIGFCEQDEFCQTVLKKHWPDVPIVDDIFKLRGEQFGTVDIISGGFPCQPFSLSGKRKGTEDNRHLWPQMFRIISEARPTWIVGENVVGIINVALKGVLSDLESIGYETQCFVIPACAVDAPHRRDRVWIIANACSDVGTFGIFDRDSKKSETKNIQKKKWSKNREFFEMASDFDKGLRKWEGDIPKPSLVRISNGLSQELDRIKSLGNAIVPQVAFKIFKSICEIERMNHAGKSIQHGNKKFPACPGPLGAQDWRPAHWETGRRRPES